MSLRTFVRSSFLVSKMANALKEHLQKLRLVSTFTTASMHACVMSQITRYFGCFIHLQTYLNAPTVVKIYDGKSVSYLRFKFRVK